MNRGYYRRQTVKPPTKRDFEAKLLLLLLIRSANKHLSESMVILRNFSKSKDRTLKNMMSISQHCAALQRVWAWDKLKANVILVKSE